MAVAPLVVGGLAGCGSSSRSDARNATSGTGAPATSTTGATSAIPTTAPARANARPALGRVWGPGGQQGYGAVKPARIFNGGDPTGLVTKVRWRSWGAARATASGVAEFVGPNQTVARGVQLPATVVAFDLGRCNGTTMYRAIEWYFPQRGQKFDPGRYIDICNGKYVGAVTSKV